MIMKGALLPTLAVALVGTLAPLAAHAADFAGKRVEILVPSAAGGGSDVYARFLAPYLTKHLPGNPTIIIRNVPGAGAIAGANQFQERAKPDGTDVGVAAASVMTNFVFKDPRGRYKLDTWIPILSTAGGTIVYARKDLGIDSSSDIEKLKGKELVLGANNPTGGDLRVLLSLDLLGFKIKPVFGLNRGEIHPSFLRGEFNINFDMPEGPELVKEGVAVPLFTLGYVDEKASMGETRATRTFPRSSNYTRRSTASRFRGRRATPGRRSSS
jgi:tripartite-type tricarboxylate transporter receptor subunit TctC